MKRLLVVLTLLVVGCAQPAGGHGRGGSWATADGTTAYCWNAPAVPAPHITYEGTHDHPCSAEELRLNPQTPHD